MNEHPADPQGLEDPALLAEIEAEFADLTREIERISAMPLAMAPQKTKLIEALRASWRGKIETHSDRPEWRQRLDETVGRAVDRLLESGIQENPDGSLGFNLRGDVLQAEGGPLMRGLLDGFVHILEEKFPSPDAAQDAAKAASAAPANPMQALMGTLGQTLAGVLKTALQNAKAPAGGDPATGTFKVGGSDLGMKVTQSDIARTSGGADTDMAFSADKKVSATFDLRTKASTRQGSEPQTTATATTTGANAFFQQLMSGFGQALQQAAKPGRPPESKAEPEQPAAKEAKPGPVDVANIGQTLLAALQRAMGPNAGAAVKSSEAPSTTEGAAAQAAEGAPKAGDAKAEGANEGAAEPAAEGAAKAEPTQEAAATGPKPASLQIDFAGLLQQLLGGKKPPGT